MSGLEPRAVTRIPLKVASVASSRRRPSDSSLYRKFTSSVVPSNLKVSTPSYEPASDLLTAYFTLQVPAFFAPALMIAGTRSL